MTDNDTQTVLVIDDSQDIHDLIRVRLRPERVRLLHAFDADSAFELLRQERPDLMLLDLDLPGLNGLELCRKIKDEQELTAIPVVFLTGTVDVNTKVQAFDAGAIDYITKPFDGVELRARVRAALRTKRFQDLLATRAQLDALTGLWNRAHFDQRLAEEVAVSQRHGRPVSLIMLDIDHFKRLNDTYGHPFGDLVLQCVAKVLSTSMRQTEIACRYGGEEFAVILRETDLDGACRTAERLRGSIAGLELQQGNQQVRVTASLGVSSNEGLVDPKNFVPADLIKVADAALYDAKRAGRNRISCGGVQA